MSDSHVLEPLGDIAESIQREMCRDYEHTLRSMIRDELRKPPARRSSTIRIYILSEHAEYLAHICTQKGYYCSYKEGKSPSGGYDTAFTLFLDIDYALEVLEGGGETVYTPAEHFNDDDQQ